MWPRGFTTSAGTAARAVVLASLWALLVASPAGACCCTCENSEECFPICVQELSDFASCNAACQQSNCGGAAPCPDPAGGQGCQTGEVSCFDLGQTPAPVPAVSTTGLVAAGLVLAAVAAASLLRQRRALR